MPWQPDGTSGRSCNSTCGIPSLPLPFSRPGRGRCWVSVQPILVGAEILFGSHVATSKLALPGHIRRRARVRRGVWLGPRSSPFRVVLLPIHSMALISFHAVTIPIRGTPWVTLAMWDSGSVSYSTRFLSLNVRYLRTLVPYSTLLHFFSVCDLLYLFFHSSPLIFPHWQLMLGGSSFFIFWTRCGLTAAKA